METSKPTAARKRKTVRGGNDLTAAQEAFCQAYVISCNGAACYAMAYAGSRKWAPQIRAQKASTLLTIGKIQIRINNLRVRFAERAEKKFEITADRVLQEMAKIGFANMLDYVSVTPEGDAYVNLADLDHTKAAAISEVTVEDFKDGRGDASRDVRRVKFKLHDKAAALHKLGLNLGLFRQGIDGEIGGKGGGPIMVTFTGDESKV